MAAVLEATSVKTAGQHTETVGNIFVLPEQKPNLVRLVRTVAVQPFVEAPVLVAS